MLHQNRVAHGLGGKNAVKEDMLADFLDLVVWGHEHECLADPVVRAWQNPKTLALSSGGHEHECLADPVVRPLAKL